MKGFFKKEEISSLSKNNSIITKRALCGTCRLWKTCHSPRMPVVGKGEKKLFLWGEVPEEVEDRKNQQLYGKAGKYLQSVLRKNGIDIERDCWKQNSVCCRPPNDKTPTDKEILYCRSNIWSSITINKPKAILLMGGVSLKSFLQHRWHSDDGLGGISKWQGYQIPDRDADCWVFPTFHPSYVLKAEHYQPVVKTIFERDIANFAKYYKNPLPLYKDEYQHVRILSTKEEVTDYLLNTILKYEPKLLAFDYETTGLKPQMYGHRIISCSMCWNYQEAVTWMWKNNNRKLFRKIMEHPLIGKCASNIKFEDTWTYERAGIKKINNWAWDTMLSAHVLDNRKGITSIKFQAYIRYGLLDYNSHLNHLLKTSDEDKEKYGANAFNKIHQIPEKELLIYNGIDSLLEYRVAVDQMKEIGIIQ